jgi:hypothetical protein
LDNESSSLRAETIANSGDYVSEVDLPQRSLFSASGNWLALATKTRLYFGYFGIGGPSITVKSDLLAEETRLDLSFSPDESRIGFQRGDYLYVFEHLGASGSVSTGIRYLVNTSPDCQNDRIALPTWCGSDRSKRQFVWSPKSDLVAFVERGGALSIANLQQRPIAGISIIEAAVHCSGECIGGFQFQP